MPITKETFEAFLKCTTKSYLYFHNVVGVPSEFSQSQGHLQETFRQKSRERLCRAVRDGQWCAGTPDLHSLEDRRYRLIVDYVVALPEIHARLDALEQIRTASDGLNCPYVPIRFVPSEKLSTYDKLLLAFDAFAFSQVCGKTPQVGRIIHGRQYTAVTVRLTDLLRRVRLVLGDIAAQQANTTATPLALNKHCPECEFRSRCRQTAIEKDDLRLLSNIGEKERKKQNDKGIFTVLQLSYSVAILGVRSRFDEYASLQQFLGRQCLRIRDVKRQDTYRPILASEVAARIISISGMRSDLLALPASRLGGGLKVSFARNARNALTCLSLTHNMVAPGGQTLPK